MSPVSAKSSAGNAGTTEIHLLLTQQKPGAAPAQGQFLDNLSSVMLGLVPLLSGLNLVDKVHGVDSTRIRAFGDDLGHERGTTPSGTRIASFMIF
ncbi:hypothetical protein [Rhizobium ruizarguesonis]|uniref:hypothetical protein n=1 Tax=Rhizobium ruizarguesonis TaxID=2081791 RepID=UPI001030BE72|nr:hypothetical protein [Rhizobium ruizarguesonis]TAY75964.1 hypothetical protein ELH84_19935 [Rhizobium ruizarguesonis]